MLETSLATVKTLLGKDSIQLASTFQGFRVRAVFLLPPKSKIRGHFTGVHGV